MQNTSNAAPNPVVIDACVLAPIVSRTVLGGVIEAGLIRPVLNARILDEAQRATKSINPENAAASVADILQFQQRHAPELVSPPTHTDITLPDPDDVHVLATAIASKTEIIVTENLRDFPAKTLKRVGVRAMRPDAFLLSLAEIAPEPMQSTLTKVEQSLPDWINKDGRSLNDLLIRSRMKRLAKWYASQLK